MFSPRPNKLALTFVLLICCTASAFSQSHVTGRLAGTITDQKGAVINGAPVVAVNQTTNDERTVVTDATGSGKFISAPSPRSGRQNKAWGTSPRIAILIKALSP